MAKAVKLADIAEAARSQYGHGLKSTFRSKKVSARLCGEKIKQLADELGYKQPSAAKKRKVGKKL